MRLRLRSQLQGWYLCKPHLVSIQMSTYYRGSVGGRGEDVVQNHSQHGAAEDDGNLEIDFLLERAGSKQHSHVQQIQGACWQDQVQNIQSGSSLHGNLLEKMDKIQVSRR